MTDKPTFEKKNEDRVNLDDRNYSLIIQKMLIIPKEDAMHKLEIKMKKFPNLNIRATKFYKYISQF